MCSRTSLHQPLPGCQVRQLFTPAIGRQQTRLEATNCLLYSFSRQDVIPDQHVCTKTKRERMDKMPCKWCITFMYIKQSQWVRTHLQPLAQHSSCEVMCHELMIDEAHDIVSEEYSREAAP